MSLLQDVASSRRSGSEELEIQARQVDERLLNATAILDSVPDVFIILNPDRQIVHANEALLRRLGLPASACLLGQRPGEALGCRNSIVTSGGCGTANACRACGALLAIIDSQAGKRGMAECSILQQDGSAIDLRVWTTPLPIGDLMYTMMALLDVSDEKRRKVLERIFFHDILNTAGGLLGYSEMLLDAEDDELQEFRGALHRLTEKLIDEICAQRQLVAAENGELALDTTAFNTRELLEDVASLYRTHEVGRQKTVEIEDECLSCTIVSDPALVRRVIGNMVKNALEAVRAGALVRIGCRQSAEGGVEYWVHNPGQLLEAVQMQIFQRSFSTKGGSRGLGTYSMKLLGERYLHGKVTFSSSAEAGTIFRLWLPINSEA